MENLSTVVGDNINIMKTTFDLNFDFIKLLNSMDAHKMETKRSCQLKSNSKKACLQLKLK